MSKECDPEATELLDSVWLIDESGVWWPPKVSGVTREAT